jgi:hypothetical protein
VISATALLGMCYNQRKSCLDLGLKNLVLKITNNISRNIDLPLKVAVKKGTRNLKAELEEKMEDIPANNMIRYNLYESMSNIFLKDSI